MIVFVKTLLLTVTSLCVRIYASQRGCMFVCLNVYDAQRLREKSLNVCASVFACLCAPN